MDNSESKSHGDLPTERIREESNVRSDAPPAVVEQILSPDILHTLRDSGVSEDVVRQLAINIRSVSVRSPLPPPEMLREYEEIIPGFGSRLLDSMDEQRRARLENERLPIVGAERRMDRSQIGSLLVVLVGLCLATFLGNGGHYWIAAIIALISVGGPAVALILGRGLAHSMARKMLDEPANTPNEAPDRSSEQHLPNSQQQRPPAPKRETLKRKNR